MKKTGLTTSFVLLIFVLCGVLTAANGQDKGRKVLLFDQQWRFYKGDTTGAQLPSFDDAGWRAVRLPHDWSIEGPFSEKWASATAYLPGGIGWYRKRFTLPAMDAGRKVFIQFNGVYKDSKVWINGHFLGERPNGFITFRYDMTPYVHIGGTNVIAVRVNHHEFADSRWYTGSGIYRNVYLIVTHPLHISKWGVFVTSQQVSGRSANLRIRVRLTNEATQAKKFELANVLIDKHGKVVGSATAKAHLIRGGKDTLTAVMEVAHPDLWSPSDPSLYTLHTIVRVAGRIIDEKTTSVGIRRFHFDANKGFFLNGVNMKLKGVCLHDDAGCLGVAVPSDVWKRRLKILKAAGCNAIRLSHNPHAPELYDLCDRMGFLLMDEAFDEWELGKHKWIKGWNVGTPGTDGYHEYFKKWADRDLRDMILRDRDHPSVILWSIGNEIDYPNDPYSDPTINQGHNPQIYGTGYLADHPAATNLRRIAGGLVAVAKRFDTTRPVTAALAAVTVSDKVGYAQLLDVTGYNYQEYRYREDHRRFPGRKLFGSENSMSYPAWKAVKDNAFVAGQFLWTGIDYMGEASKWPSRSNGAGLLDLAGFKKPEYYFRQSLWANTPMIYIGTARVTAHHGKGSLWSHHRADPVWDYSPGDEIAVSCFTNCTAAELFLNGRSLGRKSMTDSTGHMISWEVPYKAGTLSVKGYKGKKAVAGDLLRTYGAAEKLKVSADVGHLKPDAESVAHLTISVVDQDGNLVYDADNEITCELQGPARLLGLESGDNKSHESYQADYRKAYHGKLLAYIQSTLQPGEITVKVTSPGLLPEVIRIAAREK
jgi:hypothetical protein